MDEVNVRISFGKINLPKASATVAVLRVSEPFKKEVPSKIGRVYVADTTHTNSTRYSDIGGGFTRQRVGLPNGTVLMVQVSRTKGGCPYSDGCVFLRVRRGANLISVTALLPEGPDSLLGAEIQVFSGEADEIAPAELRVLGISVPEWYRKRYCDPEEVCECIGIDVVRQGDVSKPTLHAVATADGVVVKAVAQEPVRRLRLRRNLDPTE